MQGFAVHAFLYCVPRLKYQISSCLWLADQCNHQSKLSDQWNQHFGIAFAGGNNTCYDDVIDSFLLSFFSSTCGLTWYALPWLMESFERRQTIPNHCISIPDNDSNLYGFHRRNCDPDRFTDKLRGVLRYQFPRLRSWKTGLCDAL